MTPYLWFQLRYVLLSGVLAFGAWAVAGRLLQRRPVRSRAWQLVLATLLVAVASALIAQAVSVAYAWAGNTRFGFVALMFYAMSGWLPLAGVIDCIATRARLRDWPFFVMIALGVGLGADALLIEPDRLQVVEHTVAFAAWPVAAPPVRLVHISDLQTVGDCERQHRAAQMINALAPDLIVVCGDYIAGPYGQPEPAIAAARRFLGELRARCGIVCVAGHSENEALRARVFAGLPLRYLRNEAMTIAFDHGRSVRLIGLTTERDGAECVAPRQEAGLVTLVASHVPDVSRSLVGRGIELHLAGHTHGGQVVIPGFGPPILLSELPRSFAKGLHWFQDHWLNVTPGIGMEGHHAPRIRLFCPPEIHLLLLAGRGDHK